MLVIRGDYASKKDAQISCARRSTATKHGVKVKIKLCSSEGCTCLQIRWSVEERAWNWNDMKQKWNFAAVKSRLTMKSVYKAHVKDQVA